MSEEFSKVEVITGVARRRRFTTEQKTEQKLAIVVETRQPGLSISYVARQFERRQLNPIREEIDSDFAARTAPATTATVIAFPIRLSSTERT